MFWITALLLVCLTIIFIQDLKYRHIHVLLPILVFVISITPLYVGLVRNIALNILFFISTTAIMVLYMSIRNKKILNPFKNYFGLGDVLFYISITPLFVLKNYIIFFIASMLFAIVLHLIIKKILQDNTVPLAGYASLLLIIFIVGDIALGYPEITLINLL